jgi:DNA-binding transcriptional ArsR family regulator
MAVPGFDRSNMLELSNMKTRPAVKALAALAQETRLAIYRLLVQQGRPGLAAGIIADRLAIPAATLSFHLKELANAGMVGARQEGRFVYYSANYDQMSGLIDYLTENCCQGNCQPAAQPRRQSRRKRVASEARL